jgi:ABC-type sugar transport system ATPase subunit
VLLDGTDLTALDEQARTRFRRRHIGFVFQFFNLIPVLTVQENVLLPLDLNDRADAAEMRGLADQGDVRLRFDVLTKTKQPELHRYWTSCDRAANVRLFRLASEVLHGVEAGVFPPVVGWQCRECQFKSRCWAWK